MNNEPLIIERIYNATVEKIWNAITNNEQMKQWYFKIADFKPEVGFEFSFLEGNEVKYLHVCKVTEVIPNEKLAYTWRFEGYPGDSLLTFELFPEGGQTRLKLTHAGLETFSSIGPDFAVSSFKEGWTHILGKSLKEFVERN